MPKFGMTMTEGLIVEWHRRVGDSVAEGEALLTVETEKVNTEVTAPMTGKVAEILFENGDEVAVGEIIAYIE